MSETKQFSKRIQDVLDGLELRAGKRKVQTKEDLKKCFRKDCVNIYSAEENGKPRLYRRTDLTTWAAEAFPAEKIISAPSRYTANLNLPSRGMYTPAAGR